MDDFLETYPAESVVRKAYAYAEKAHEGVARASGEPYFIHCRAVAATVREWNLDDTAVAAALLHDVVEDTDTTVEELEREFTPEIAGIVSGLTKLRHLEYKTNDPHIENLRRFVISFCQDLRVLIVKLADRLHNMRTLGALPEADRVRIAWETVDVYAPLAYRLGMQRLSGELEDLAFPFIHPDEHRWLTETVGESYTVRRKYTERIEPVLLRALGEHGIRPLAVDSRAKRYWSLYKKLQRHSMDLDRIYDLVAVRIIVKSVEECYAALGVIHQLWPPLPGRFKDYIARPKQNGYRSLHTTVFCEDHRITEFQIRTQEMHEENELGIAAHWAYQQEKKSGPQKASQWKGVEKKSELLWVEQLRNWQKTFATQEEFVQALKVDFFKDRIFLITPENDILDLPQGATPVDFAYRIHSDIGDSCVGARVNGKIVPLEYELSSGDIVEILTQRGKKPSEDWLRFTKTEMARKHIKSAIRSKDKTLVRRADGPHALELKIVNRDRPGYLKDVTAVFARKKINITFLESQTDPRATFSVVTVRCEGLPKIKIEQLLVALKKISGTNEVSWKASR